MEILWYLLFVYKNDGPKRFASFKQWQPAEMEKEEG